MINRQSAVENLAFPAHDSTEPCLSGRQVVEVRTGRRQAGRKLKAFTLVELLVVVAIISLLMSILLPSLNRARELARRTICMTQLKQIGTAFVMYAADWRDYLPYCYEAPTCSWYVLLANPYMGFSQTDTDLALEVHNNVTVFTCPTQLPLHPESVNKRTYGMNRYAGVGANELEKIMDAKTPSDTCLAGDGHYRDSGPFWVAAIGPLYLSSLTEPFPEPVHSDGDNFLYMDMHVGWWLWDDIPYESTTDEGKQFWMGK